MEAEAAVWSALADPNRRAILGLLLEGARPVGELAEACGLSQPNTSKHLRVLHQAGLVRIERDAQRRLYSLEPGPMAELDAWLEPYRQRWNRSLDALECHLEAVRADEAANTEEAAASAPTAPPAPDSNATETRRNED